MVFGTIMSKIYKRLLNFCPVMKKNEFEDFDKINPRKTTVHAQNLVKIRHISII